MATTKKRSAGEGETPKARKTTTKASTKTTTRKSAPVAPSAVKAAVKAGAKKTTRPKLKSSYATPEHAPGKPAARKGALRTKAAPAPRGKAGAAKAPLAAPKRQGVRKAPLPEVSSATRELAMSIASAGLEKKAMGVEILDVRGRVDYADFLVIMTGRSDRHVAAIAQGIEEELSKKKIKAISTEGLPAATWVLLDYGDVVVHVFQEDARQLYDIEGLWMDASRVSVPNDENGNGNGNGTRAPTNGKGAPDDDE